MRETELPSSVLYNPLDFGHGTLSRQDGDYKLLEKDGIKLQRRQAFDERTIHFLAPGNKHTAIIFKPNQEIDTIGLIANGEPKRWFSRNGIYVEVGTGHDDHSSLAQYNLVDGSLILQTHTIDAPLTEFPLHMEMQDVQAVVQTCEILRNFRTPEISSIRQIIDLSERTISTPLP